VSTGTHYVGPATLVPESCFKKLIRKYFSQSYSFRGVIYTYKSRHRSAGTMLAVLIFAASTSLGVSGDLLLRVRAALPEATLISFLLNLELEIERKDNPKNKKKILEVMAKRRLFSNYTSE
jgi:hypothetical protein